MNEIARPSATTLHRRHARAKTCIVSLAISAGVASLLVACVGDDPGVKVPSTSLEDASTQVSQDSGDGTPQDSGEPTTDAGAGADVDATPLRFCQTQKPPAGVADFFCADFDGANVGEGFTEQIVPAGGVLEQSTDIYFSEPNSLTTKKNAELIWKKTGPLPFSEVMARVRVNVGTLGGAASSASGSVRILQLSGPEVAAVLELGYVHGRVVDGQSHSGYVLQFSACPSACSYFEKRIPTPLSASVWTDLMVSWTKAGLVTVSYDGAKIVNMNVDPMTFTNVEAHVGVVAAVDPPLFPRHSFDNVVISVMRQ